MWEKRSRVGVYLGPILAHARSVGPIMSLTTGLMSLQIHDVKYDDSFELVKRLKLANSLWQQKCHFVALQQFNLESNSPLVLQLREVAPPMRGLPGQ